jgi:NitT/TauT family transport system ATP-binding protein
MDNSNRTVIEVKNLNVVFNDIKLGLNAVRDLSFKVKENEFVSIIGPSGCGKSTLFKVIGDILNGEDSDISGQIEVLETSPQMARKNRDVGIVFQKPTLLEWRSVAGNVTLPLEIIGIKKEEQKRRANELLEMVDLEKYHKFRPSKLSGGMQQRVSIARALAYDPELLLMDEPFGALDEINRRKMNDELIKIWQKTNKTVLFVTHSIEEAVYLSQKIIVLTERPGTVKEIIDIDLPYPRREVQETNKFFKYIKKVRKNLEAVPKNEKESY